MAAASQRPYIWRVMRKRKQYLWEVSRLGGSAAKFIGSVYAADENQALKAAIKELKIGPALPIWTRPAMKPNVRYAAAGIF
jgi:hypothetical protein